MPTPMESPDHSVGSDDLHDLPEPANLATEAPPLRAHLMETSMDVPSHDGKDEFPLSGGASVLSEAEVASNTEADVSLSSHPSKTDVIVESKDGRSTPSLEQVSPNPEVEGTLQDEPEQQTPASGRRSPLVVESEGASEQTGDGDDFPPESRTNSNDLQKITNCETQESVRELPESDAEYPFSVVSADDGGMPGEKEVTPDDTAAAEGQDYVRYSSELHYNEADGSIKEEDFLPRLPGAASCDLAEDEVLPRDEDGRDVASERALGHGESPVLAEGDEAEAQSCLLEDYREEDENGVTLTRSVRSSLGKVSQWARNARLLVQFQAEFESIGLNTAEAISHRAAFPRFLKKWTGKLRPGEELFPFSIFLDAVKLSRTRTINNRQFCYSTKLLRFRDELLQEFLRAIATNHRVLCGHIQPLTQRTTTARPPSRAMQASRVG